MSSRFEMLLLLFALPLVTILLAESKPFELENDDIFETDNDEMESQDDSMDMDSEDRLYQGDIHIRDAPFRKDTEILMSGTSREKYSIIRFPVSATGEFLDNGTEILNIEGYIHQMSFDCQLDRVVWSGWSDKAVKPSIRTAFLNGTKPQEFFIDSSARALAFDWSSRNIYIINDETKSINVLSVDGKYQHNIFNFTGYIRGRFMALDLKNRHLFFNYNTSIIKRVDMDGANVMTFVDSNLFGIGPLVVLQQRQELCWAGDKNFDGTREIHQLECIGLDQRHRRVVFESESWRIHALTAYNDERFYWTDSDYSDSYDIVHSVGITGAGYTQWRSVWKTEYPQKILALYNICNGEKTECAVNNGGCPHLCLPKAGGGVRCVCPDNVEDLEGCD